MKKHIIGTGQLTWQRHERISDRYGSVWLMTQGTEAPEPITVPKNGIGTIYARVIEPIPSDHIGDMFHGYRQRELPANGVKVPLGYGSVFTEQNNGITSIGVRPIDKRRTDWLNPVALYNLHNSVVELTWEK